MVATKNISEDEIILEEEPLVSSQFSWNKSYSYLACDHCLFPLETAEQNIRRLTFDQTIILPYPEVDKTADIQLKIVTCPGCGIPYCSTSCLLAAENKYHRILCPLLKPNQSLDLINEMWK